MVILAGAFNAHMKKINKQLNIQGCSCDKCMVEINSIRVMRKWNSLYIRMKWSHLKGG